MSKVSEKLKKEGRTIFSITPLIHPLRGAVGEIICLRNPYKGPARDWGYIRVSTENQMGNGSLEKQAAFCAVANFIVWEVGSGFDDDRPGYWYIKNNLTENSGVVALTLDRWTRSAVVANAFGGACLLMGVCMYTSEFILNVLVSEEQVKIETKNYLFACAGLEDNYATRQAGINQRKKQKKNYPGRKLKVTEALFKKYLGLKKKHPT